MYSVVFLVEVGDTDTPHVAGNFAGHLDIFHDDAGQVQEAVSEEVNVELDISAGIAYNDNKPDEEGSHYDFEARNFHS